MDDEPTCKTVLGVETVGVSGEARKGTMQEVMTITPHEGCHSPEQQKDELMVDETTADPNHKGRKKRRTKGLQKKIQDQVDQTAHSDY